MMETNDVRLYYMDKIEDIEAFISAPVGSLSRVGLGVSKTTGLSKLSAVFDRVLVNGNPVTVESVTGNSLIKKGIVAHEIGHQVDTIKGSPSTQTGPGSFGESLQKDYDKMLAGYINFEPCSAVFPANVCNDFPGPNSNRLEAWLEGRSEVFARLFSESIYPDTEQSDVKKALGFLKDTIPWMANYRATL